MSRTASLPVGLLLPALMLVALLNYQAVLRDAAGAPLTGSYDIVFRFYDQSTIGQEILADWHFASRGGAARRTGA